MSLSGMLGKEKVLSQGEVIDLLLDSGFAQIDQFEDLLNPISVICALPSAAQAACYGGIANQGNIAVVEGVTTYNSKRHTLFYRGQTHYGLLQPDCSTRRIRTSAPKPRSFPRNVNPGSVLIIPKDYSGNIKLAS